ncbi:MAG: FecR domain-containing protein [Saprospiraceae bacterium]|nr:FecR domain-containing protein [Saprospiraceae bacterium]
MDKFWEISGKYQKSHQPDVDAAWRKFEDRIKAEQKGKVVPMGRRALPYAAAVLILVAFVFLLQNNFLGNRTEMFYATTNQETKQIELPDGSIVTLNENSTLKVSVDFGTANRSVTLSGEAFFDVTRNENQPFIISADHIKVEVLGTSFNVRDYADEKEAEVEVKSGKVKVSPPNQSKGVLLEKGDLALLDLNAKMLEKKPGEGYNVGGWMEKQLVFIDAPVAQIFEDIQRIYKVNFITDNTNIINCSFDTDFKGEDLSTVFEILEIAFHCKFKQLNASTYEVVGGQCNQE